MNQIQRAALAFLAAGGALVAASWLAAPSAESSAPRRAPAQVTAAPTRTPVPTPVPVGGRIQADNACYVRLQDLPPAPYNGPGRYGMFGAINPGTGVLAAAGGAAKANDDNTIAYYQMYAIKLDSPAAKWNLVQYGPDGYTREFDKGCREMASVALTHTLSLSVLGKDGCDNGRVDTRNRKGGDVRGITIGASADASGVGFVPMRIASAPPLLVSKLGNLARHFGTYDWKRNRAILGQGSFNDEREPETQDDIYEAVWLGTTVKVSRLAPSGPIPERRYGSCAAYVHDPATGVDGVMVLGGQEGGPPGTTRTFNQVWWLDFAASEQGEWREITSRFSNQKDFGGRREGACAYDPATKYFYSWMGRASSGIPDGASRSGGVWRTSLAQLADAAAPLSWERLAKDNLKGISGRRLIPNVYDGVNKRLFVIGGRGGSTELDEFKDVWAIYPDVTGAACETLDPYAPYAPANPTATAVRPEPPTPAPVPATAKACPQLTGIVPDAVVAAALADPAKVQGWGELANPNLPAGPLNPYRASLGLQNPSSPYNPTYNSVVFKAGCP